MDKDLTWEQVLNEHWRQFNLACKSMNYEDKMPMFNWREYVLYDMCKRHNKEIGKEYFIFNEEDQFKDSKPQKPKIKTAKLVKR